MRVMVTEEAIEPWQLLTDQHSTMSELNGKYGATAVFVGTMRDFNEGDHVKEMYLEHYPGMTEKHLENICAQATAEHGLLNSLVVHRVGRIRPNEPIVLVAVWAAHRKQAFEACREIMEDLKSKAPFWKKEHLDDGDDRWVEKNTRG